MTINYSSDDCPVLKKDESWHVAVPRASAQAEQSLEQTLAKVEQAKREWEATVDSLIEIVCLVDEDGRLLRANQSVETWGLGRVWGIKGRQLHELFHARCADPACWLQLFFEQAKQLAGRGESAERESYDDLLNRYVRISVRPMRYRNQLSANRAIVVVQDITERKRIEEAEREQRTLAEALRDTAAVLNSTLQFDEVLDRILNHVGRVVPHDAASIMLVDDGVAAVARHVGYDRHSTAANLYSIRLRISDRPSLRYMYESRKPLIISDTRTYPDRMEITETYWIRSYLGAPICVKGHIIGFLNLDSATPAFFSPVHADRLQAFADQAAVAIENGQLYELSRRHADELEQRVAERTAELERERQRLSAILEAAGEGIILTDAGQTIVYANTTMEQMTGYTIAEMLGETPRLWRSKHTPSAVYEEMKRALASGEGWRGEVINVRKDGMLYDVALTITPLTTASGGPIGFVGIQRDISRLKEIDRLKDQFVSRIGHELRTPVTNIKLYVELLEHGKPDKHDQYMQVIRAQTAQLQTLVEGFLEVAELDASTTSIHLVPTDVNLLAADIIDDLRTQTAERSLSLDFYPEPHLPWALVDPASTARVMSNLIANALDYTPRGGQVTVLTALGSHEGQDWITFAVQDTGPGISPAEMQRIFDRFYRGEAARNFTRPGAGLGLSICKAIIDRLSGRITIDSEPGRGATFTVWLRVAEPHDLPLWSSSQPAVYRKASYVSGRYEKRPATG